MLQFKFDENLNPIWRDPLRRAGHRVSTVVEEGLAGIDDESLAATCKRLNLCLITADMGFAQPLRYPPAKYHGLIILRHPKPSLSRMYGLIQQVVEALRGDTPAGRLWVVEPGRIRIFGMPRDEETSC